MPVASFLPINVLRQGIENEVNARNSPQITVGNFRCLFML